MASYSGLYDGVLGTPHALVVNRNSNHSHLARKLKRQDSFVERRMVGSLTSATAIAAAAAADVVKPVVVNDSTAGGGPGNGGVRVIEQRVMIQESATVGVAGAATAVWIATHASTHGALTDLSGNGNSSTGPLLGVA